MELLDAKFFNPAPDFREMAILRAIMENPDISQEQLSSLVGVVPSMINRYLKDFEERDLIEKRGKNKRKMSYRILESGKQHLQYLIIGYLSDISKLYRSSRNIFLDVLMTISKENIRKVFLYGAGIVGKMLANVLISEEIEIVGFIDDSLIKQGSQIQGITIYSVKEAVNMDYDAVLIASFAHTERIRNKALSKGLKTLYLFEINERGKVFLLKADGEVENNA